MKKFLSIFLVFTLIFNSVPEKSFAMERATPIEEKSSSFSLKLPLIVLFSTIGAVVFGFTFGYKKGNNRRIADEKEVTLTGSIDPYDITPNFVGGKYYTDRILNQFIDKLLLEDVPKLSFMNEFPASYLAAIEFELSALSLRYNGKDSPYEYKKLTEELESMSLFIGSYVDVRNKKIQAGYLKKLLKDAQKLVQKATATTEKMEREKEQNEREL